MAQHPETLTITLLGTGTSTGIPVIGCSCRVCTSPDPRDKRLRCSCLIQTSTLTVIIDTGPDFRMQALTNHLTRLDAVLYTHHHFDHVMGIDDLRPFCTRISRPLPCYASPQTAHFLRQMFQYIFEDGSYPGVPRLELQEITRPFEINGRYNQQEQLQIIPIPVFHGKTPILGYRIGGVAYLTDTSFIPEESFQWLQGLDVLILDALRYRPHPTHFTIDQAVATAQRIGAKETYFIHMSHDILHAETEQQLPPGIHLGYDNLKLTIPYETFNPARS